MSDHGRRRGTAAAAALAAALLLGGCGGTPPVSPTAGVDGLTIPTPDPDPYDFTAEVDHPLFPLADDPTWTYEGPEGSTVELSVDGTDLVDGVEVTTVRRVLRDRRGRTVGERRSSFAQDTDGNVWSFGREVLEGDGRSWEAGTDGAEAGLLLPARPRVGDAWLQQESEALTTTVEVLELDDRVDALGGQVEAVSTRDRATGADVDEDVVRYYAPGLGIVRVEDAVTGEPLLELTDVETP
ncbi:hypothetical protein [uncultured Nocardioides sp.]|uniref:hypothetical protein n=1 Tax=uncultured Nocardioides sp. TaxID=198441 RepID=UPI00262645F4|nr:hypothetical protein [uncultured Nocardioides sp.]